MDYPNHVFHGLMFHHFHGPQHPQGQGSMSQEELEDLLQCVGLARILSPREWMQRLETRTLQPEHVCLTFDDALRCQFDIALPVLERHGLTAFWFVYSSVCEGHLERLEVYRTFRSRCFQDIEEFYDRFFQRVFASEFAARARAVLEEAAIARHRATFPFYTVNDVQFRFIRDRALPTWAYEQIMDAMIQDQGSTLDGLAQGLWLSNDQLQYLSARGHAIGLHSYSHPTILAQLPLQDQREEYHKNYAHIAAICGQAPVAMAHPANSYTEETLGILTELGVRCGFRSNMSPAQTNGPLNPRPLELARQDHANIRTMMHRV